MLVYGDEITQWAQDRMPARFGFDAPLSVGIIRKNRLVGAVVYDNYRPLVSSVSVSIVIDEKSALTKGVLRKLFFYPFVTLNCKRLQALIDSTNHDSVELCKRLGFEYEGRLRQASPIEGNDLLVFGMLKGECRWINLQTGIVTKNS